MRNPSMKNKLTLLLTLLLTLMVTLPVMAQEETPELEIRMSRDFGYGGFGAVALGDGRRADGH